MNNTVNKRLTPIQVGILAGLPAGLIIAVAAWTSGAYRTGGALPALLDASFAFVFGAALFGGVGAFVQWRRLVATQRNAAPAGWYDSPKADATEWYWSGSEWTGQTRPARDAMPRFTDGSSSADPDCSGSRTLPDWRHLGTD